jgi:protein-L-isoaspartate(D-aspartate) O-methyltransferase
LAGDFPASGTTDGNKKKHLNFNKLKANNNMNTDFARRQMVAQQVRPWDVFNQDVLQVLGSIAREQFVPHSCVDVAYADTEIPLAYGQVMLRPLIEGRLLQALDLRTGDQVLEIGTGTGYLTACLARLSGSVSSIDIHEDFIAAAGKNLEAAEIRNVSLECMDAMAELPRGEFDAIAVTGSVPRLDERFVRALKPGGRLFLVVGESPLMSALLMLRADDELQQSSLFETDIPALENIAREPVFSFA